jgi:bifunctional non-homologous end joining protein LigD
MARTSRLPKRLQPMLATLTDGPFDDPEWVFESKWDGNRVVAVIEKRRVTVYSRNGKIVSGNYMPIAKALEKVRHDAVIDGELVALDAKGISRFQLLQNALRTSANLHYCMFDLMALDGEDLRRLPLIERKARLKPIVPRNRLLSFSSHRRTHDTRYFKEAESEGLEGIMAKRAQSMYFSGARSTDWLKIKTGKEQEVVVVGFTAPRRSRPHFGSLVMAVRDGATWRYVGHVGTGFSHSALAEIHAKLSPLRTESAPFTRPVKDEASTTWVRPRLVAEVKFTEWTDGGEMRHPAFVGLRDDKTPEEVVLERPRRQPPRSRHSTHSR